MITKSEEARNDDRQFVFSFHLLRASIGQWRTPSQSHTKDNDVATLDNDIIQQVSAVG